MGSCCSKKEKESLEDRLDRLINTLDSIGNYIIRPQFFVGSVDGSILAKPVTFTSSEFGDSNQPKNPFVNRIYIDDKKNQSCEIATPGDNKKSLFVDPRSIWYNVFLGYYEIIAKKSEGWDRPFGYQGEGFKEIHKYDFAMLFAADWNYISCWMYGVPTEVCDEYCPEKIALKEKTDEYIKVHGRIQPFPESSQKYWDYVELMHIPSPSCYESRAKGAKKLNNTQNPFTPLWQLNFGLQRNLPDLSQEFPESFPEAKMHGREFVYWYEEDDAYHTVIFGAFGNSANPPNKSAEEIERFIEVQQKACGESAAQHYSNLGWDSKE